ncbi:DDE-type integrase/transposase/recombinase [Sorangium sp. So ce281]|uniref:DDE-type integrase/transposase/recombinase n=1 Tax=Sorangium sp. So ce281 TaxID=3133293 RepID=UPI003F5F3E80
MDLGPADHAEAVAIFRASVIGPVMHRELGRGRLATELRALSAQRFRPPGADSTRTYSVPTLERWLYAYRAAGLAGLRPEPRSDRGFAQELRAELRELLLDIRREHPAASVSLILSTLVDEGRIDPAQVSAPTVRRLYAAAGLSRRAERSEQQPRTRLRWQAERPGALWHGDVCHLPQCKMGGRTVPVRIHGLLDDASRYVVALEAHSTEREVDMLGLLVDALRRHGKPDALYLDNGSTYRGEVLRTACSRLGITLLHAKPYDPQARGKMERFWRTLREGCLSFLGEVASLKDIDARLKAFLERRYHAAPHAGLMGKSPAKLYAQKPAGEGAIEERALRAALTERSRRRVSSDNVISIDGEAWELDQGYLAGQLVTVAHCHVAPDATPWVEHEGKRLPLRLLDPAKNARRRRPPRGGPLAQGPSRPTDFAPTRALLRAASERPQASQPDDSSEGGAR